MRESVWYSRVYKETQQVCVTAWVSNSSNRDSREINKNIYSGNLVERMILFLVLFFFTVFLPESDKKLRKTRASECENYPKMYRPMRKKDHYESEETLQFI